MSTKISFQKGTIYLVDLKFYDCESSETRPIVVLGSDEDRDEVIFVPVSPLTQSRVEPDTVPLTPGDDDFSETGLKEESLVLVRRISFIQKKALFSRLGRLTQRYIDEIETILLKVLSLGYAPDNRKKRDISYSKQSIDEKDVFSVVRTLRSAFITQGPSISLFEKAIADYCGAMHAVAVSNGTAALHLACLVAGLKEGDILWTSPNSFVAPANCAFYCGAVPDFVDIDQDTFNIDVSLLKDKLQKAEKEGNLPKVVIPVHFAGQPCEMNEINSLAKVYNFTVIEDACHAFGASYKGFKVGSCRFSDMTVFSFHPVKTVTMGEGGVVLTNNRDIYDRLILLRSHGITKDRNLMDGDSDGPWYYQQIDLGMNYRITDFQASLGLSQLARVDQFVSRRKELAERYNYLLADLPLKLSCNSTENMSAHHLYVVRLDFNRTKKTKKSIFKEAKDNSINLNVHYIPVHLQPYYRKSGFSSGQFKECESYYSEAITLPLYPLLSEQEQDHVVSTLGKILLTA